MTEGLFLLEKKLIKLGFCQEHRNLPRCFMLGRMKHRGIEVNKNY